MLTEKEAWQAILGCLPALGEDWDEDTHPFDTEEYCESPGLCQAIDDMLDDEIISEATYFKMNQKICLALDLCESWLSEPWDWSLHSERVKFAIKYAGWD
jgi:hypothetical protein